MILQPKRWQKADDPKYDPIRHRSWFARLLKRKHIIPLMEAAWSYSFVKKSDTTQKEICELWGIDPREFRDYCCFMSGFVSGVDPAYQHILDGAYKLYCEHNAIRPIQRFIDDVAPLYGVKSRPVFEMWQVNPIFYPTNYDYPRN